MIRRIFKSISNFLDEDTHRAERNAAVSQLQTREVRRRAQSLWSTLDELVQALEAMPKPTSRRLDDALKAAKAELGKVQPW